jgi:hypothetical protein
VVDALDALRVPAGELILFLGEALGLGAEQDQRTRQEAQSTAAARPLVMLSAILVLTMRELERADASESSDGLAGQQAFLRIQSKARGGAKPARTAKDAVKSGQVPGSPEKHDEAAQKPKSGADSSGTESDGTIDSLEPLEVQRSLSVPISGPKGSLRPASVARATQAAAEEKSSSRTGGQEGGLDEDEQLLALFRLAVWICRRPEGVLSRPEKAALLLHAIQNMNIVSKRARSVGSLAQVVQLGQGELLELCVAILCLGEPKLSAGLKTLLEERLTHPHALTVVGKYEAELRAGPAASEDGKRELAEVQAFLADERKKHREVLRAWIQQAQGLLIWLVDRQRGCPGAEPSPLAPRAVSASSPWVALLHQRCTASAHTWVEHLSFLLHGYIGYTTALRDLDAVLDEGAGGSSPATGPKGGPEGTKAPEEEHDEEELVPLKVAKSLSLPIARQPHQGVRLSSTETSVQLIRSLMALLATHDAAAGGELE